MKIYADLHVHSKHARGCSIHLDLHHMEKYGRIKGLNLIGTGDFTHPEWIKELKSSLTERDGLYYTKTDFPFMLQTELSFIYSQDGKGRRVHLVVWAPSFEVVDQITEYLLRHGRVDYDGRPIFKIPCGEFVSEMKNISRDIEVIPAHIWTPHFSLFGEYSQFNTVQECFGDATKHIHAMETGLSSDPLMNARLSQLDKYQIVSFSDAHSFWPWRLGREATVFDCNMSYADILKAVRTGTGLSETIEVDPNLGKYHFSGHRKCDVCLDPQASLKAGRICPKCGKKLIIGVAERIEELADRTTFEAAKKVTQSYKTIIPLSELFAAVLGKGVATKTVQSEVMKLLDGRCEFQVLLEMSEQELSKIVDPALVKAILQNRTGNITVQPGYDGVYGKPQM